MGVKRRHYSEVLLPSEKAKIREQRAAAYLRKEGLITRSTSKSSTKAKVARFLQRAPGYLAEVPGKVAKAQGKIRTETRKFQREFKRESGGSFGGSSLDIGPETGKKKGGDSLSMSGDHFDIAGLGGGGKRRKKASAPALEIGGGL